MGDAIACGGAPQCEIGGGWNCSSSFFSRLRDWRNLKKRKVPMTRMSISAMGTRTIFRRALPRPMIVVDGEYVMARGEVGRCRVTTRMHSQCRFSFYFLFSAFLFFLDFPSRFRGAQKWTFVRRWRWQGVEVDVSVIWIVIHSAHRGGGLLHRGYLGIKKNGFLRVLNENHSHLLLAHSY